MLEADPEYVGGLAKTVRYKGHRFDVGGHRFYSNSAEINRETLGYWDTVDNASDCESRQAPVCERALASARSLPVRLNLEDPALRF